MLQNVSAYIYLLQNLLSPKHCNSPDPNNIFHQQGNIL